MLGAALGAIGSIAGGIINNMGAKAAADEAYENQKNIIQHQTSWLVKDAKRNGIHPLAVLGMNPASGPPPAAVFDSGIGQAASSLGDALERKMDPMSKLQVAQMQLQLEKGALENDFTRAAIASQRMRNIQQSTPGVRSTTGNDVTVLAPGTIPVPGVGNMRVTHKGLGQEAENDFGEVGGAILGLGNLAHSGLDTLARRYGFSIDETPAAVAARAYEYFKRQLPEAPPYNPSSYGSPDWSTYNW